MTIAITGSTGHLGRLVIDLLKDRGRTADIVALARTPARGADLGVEVREADYDRPDTLVPALAGVDTLLFISASEAGRRTTQHRNVIESAKAAGVKWIVYTSVLRANTSPLSIAPEHRETEAMLRSSDVPFTLLRHGWYTENYTGQIPGALAGGAFLGSADNGKTSPATRADFAEAAVAVLTGRGHEGKTYELAGDESFTMRDLAAEVSKQTGKDIVYKNLTEAAYAEALIGFGLPEAAARVIAGYDVATRDGALLDDSHQLSALIGRRTTPLSVAVADALRQMPET